jgi:hypothetical protein
MGSYFRNNVLRKKNYNEWSFKGQITRLLSSNFRCVIIFYTISFYCLAIKRSEWKEQYVALACRSIKMGGRQKHLAVQHLQRTTINPHCYMSLDEGMLKLRGYTTTVIEQSSTALVQFQACELNRSHPKAARACVCVCAKWRSTRVSFLSLTAVRSDRKGRGHSVMRSSLVP